jgi:hypothetical protein
MIAIPLHTALFIFLGGDVHISFSFDGKASVNAGLRCFFYRASRGEIGIGIRPTLKFVEWESSVQYKR